MQADLSVQDWTLHLNTTKATPHLSYDYDMDF